MRRAPIAFLCVVIPGFLALGLAACDNDRGARKDLPDNQQQLDDTTVQVFLMPDKFPNLSHKCEGTTGMWTDTGRDVWIVYEDTLCDGNGTGMVLDNIPGAKTQVVQS